MNLETAKKLLANCGFKVVEERAIPYGTQIRLNIGVTVSVYDKGTYQVQGNEESKEAAENCLRDATPSNSNNSSNQLNREVFVVYGHDENAKTQLEAILRRWGLTPLFMDQLASEGRTLIENLEVYTERAQYAVVLATPDDEGYPKNSPENKKFRARQNVVLELGMVLQQLGRKQVAILLKTPNMMERPSDIDGLIYIEFGDAIDKGAQLKLADAMNNCGYNIQVSDVV